MAANEHDASVADPAAGPPIWTTLDVQRGEEEVRRRLSRDLHDQLGQTVTALSLGLQAVRSSGGLPPVAVERLTRLQQLVDDLGRQMHDIAARLRPTALDDLGLEPALRQLIADWSNRTGVEAEFHVSGLAAERFSPAVETALFRVVQEALTNVARHSRARRVGVVVARREGHGVAVVEDDGCGFDPEAVSSSANGQLGLIGMRERVVLVGGTVEIESRPGEGTTVYARIPLEKDGVPRAS